MKGQKIGFVCSSCGYEAGKWYGRCPECNNWNTFEEVAVADTKKSYAQDDFSNSSKPQKLSDVKSVKQDRLSTGNIEFDRVLGGSLEQNSLGIVPGSVILLSGDPGIGKSTILLQIALALCASGKKVLYVTGEESESQVKLRAERIDLENNKKTTGDLLIFATTNIDRAVEEGQRAKPDLVIVDSIQTMASASFPGFAGSVPQIRYATSRLVNLAKKNHIPVILVGHVTKEGIVAGPMILSHMVDTVLYMEGEKLTGTRILRAFKNRFGDTNEVGIFLMEDKGLVAITESSQFIERNDKAVAGSCLTVIMEGSRPLLVEVQALAVTTSLPFPRRVSSGIPDKRLELLLAVIQKTCKIPLERMDVFVNVVGGLKISETAGDLAVCLALISSYKNKSLGSLVAIAEVGLLGELKSVGRLDKRINEAKKFGFKKIYSVKDAGFVYDILNKGL